MRKIELDRARFKRIVHGTIKKELKKYISNTDLIGKKGKNLINITIPWIEIPHFTFGRESGGVGAGDGKNGESVPSEPSDRGGDAPGQHILEVELTLEELADIFGEELKLPKIEPKGVKNIVNETTRYIGIRRSGPESLRHRKRTFKEALKRQIMMGTYIPEHPVIIPEHEDKRYRSAKKIQQISSNAVIIYMMDVSGSMGQQQKDIVRTMSFWIETWLKRHYPHVEMKYIVHDVAAKEVDRETFYHINESGGTLISSAYTKCSELIDKAYRDFNVYPFHFSDGDNGSENDSLLAIQILRDSIIPSSNQFCYGQVKTGARQGNFIRNLQDVLLKEKKLVCAEIEDKDGICDAMKTFFGGK
ncbi:MAG: DUF444 family protein [Candidatus Aenigmarchaeota archaeon]|nr:DUF444 family protein [Candidatus Aenigmarchaeota archaeon]